MADTAVAVTNLSFTGYISATGDVTSGSIGTTVSAGDTAVITAPAGDTGNLFFTFSADGGSATATFEGGDEPPSENSGLGNSAAIALGDTLPQVIVVEAGRFVQSNGTIRIAIATNDVVVGCFRRPLGN
jgi:hypothetical protein